MQIKKSGGRIYGATLTSAEKKAMNIEIRRQLAEMDKKNMEEVDATVLYVLMTEFGFGKKRLRRFHDTFGEQITALVHRYQMNSDDDVWLCTEMLKRRGIDINQWNKELESKNKENVK